MTKVLIRTSTQGTFDLTRPTAHGVELVIGGRVFWTDAQNAPDARDLVVKVARDLGLELPCTCAGCVSPALPCTCHGSAEVELRNGSQIRMWCSDCGCTGVHAGGCDKTGEVTQWSPANAVAGGAIPFAAGETRVVKVGTLDPNGGSFVALPAFQVGYTTHPIAVGVAGTISSPRTSEANAKASAWMAYCKGAANMGNRDAGAIECYGKTGVAAFNEWWERYGRADWLRSASTEPAREPAACCGCLCTRCRHQGGDGQHDLACLSVLEMMSASDGFKPWPADQPARYNGAGTPCDMWTGPCCCGATHKAGK